jgi:hypothetical protein
MRPLLYIIAGLALLIVVLIAGGIGWFTNTVHTVATTKVGSADPKALDTVRTTFETNCSKRATEGVTDYQQVALIKQVCTCDARALVNYVKKKKDASVLELEIKVLKQDPELSREFDSCARAYGIDVPYQ